MINTLNYFLSMDSVTIPNFEIKNQAHQAPDLLK